MGVPHGHLNVGVPQQVGYGPQVGPGHHQPAGKCVAQIVPGEIFESGLSGCIFKPMSGPAQGVAVIAAGKDRVFAFGPPTQLLEGSKRSLVKSDMPAPAVLALRHKQIPARQVNT